MTENQKAWLIAMYEDAQLEARQAIDNEETWADGAPDPISKALHYANAEELKSYIQILQLLLESIEQVDVGKTCDLPETENSQSPVETPAEMTCGKPPYTAEIVQSSGEGTVWSSDSLFGTEHAAELAITKQAASLGHRVEQYSRHWITSDGKHMVDYGSHAFYGVITSRANEDRP